MHRVLLVSGTLLSVLALVSYGLSGFAAATALIPLAIGLPMVVCGALAGENKPRATAALRVGIVLAVVGFLAAASRLPALSGAGLNKSVSVLGMCVVCLGVLVSWLRNVVAGRRAGA